MPGFDLTKYTMVKDRIPQFYQKYPAGRIITTIVEHSMEAGFILMRAEVFRFMSDDRPAAVGHAYELKTEGHVNKTSYVENCETSAVGRALAFLNLGIEEAIASMEEMQKVENLSTKSDPEIVKAIVELWLSGKEGASQEGLEAWVKKNNGGIPLGQLPASRQQAILSDLQAAKERREKNKQS